MRTNTDYCHYPFENGTKVKGYSYKLHLWKNKKVRFYILDTTEIIKYNNCGFARQ
jgi:hypothetical protein